MALVEEQERWPGRTRHGVVEGGQGRIKSPSPRLAGGVIVRVPLARKNLKNHKNIVFRLRGSVPIVLLGHDRLRLVWVDLILGYQ